MHKLHRSGCGMCPTEFRLRPNCRHREPFTCDSAQVLHRGADLSQIPAADHRAAMSRHSNENETNLKVGSNVNVLVFSKMSNISHPAVQQIVSNILKVMLIVVCRMLQIPLSKQLWERLVYYRGVPWQSQEMR